MALYQDYRPQRFNEVKGQNITRTLCVNALKNDKIPHAILFYGPHGTGKTTLARLLASGIVCQEPLEDSLPCGKCEQCQMVINNSHPDILELDAASHRGIDDAKKIRDRINHAPILSKAHVLILDEAHMLTREAQNALLKTIEEPKTPVHIFLCTTEKHKILETIQSRCQRFPLQKPDGQDLKQLLIEVCQQENYEYEEESIDYIINVSGGSFRDALSNLEKMVNSHGSINIEAARAILALPEKQDVIDIIQDWQKQDWESLDSILNKVSQNVHWNTFIENLAVEAGKELLKTNDIKLTFFIEACDKTLKSSLPYPLSLQYTLRQYSEDKTVVISKPQKTSSKQKKQDATQHPEDKKETTAKKKSQEVELQIEEAVIDGSWSAARTSVMIPLIAMTARNFDFEVYVALRTVKSDFQKKTLKLFSSSHTSMPKGTKEWLSRFTQSPIEWEYTGKQQKAMKPQKLKVEDQKIKEPEENLTQIDDIFNELEIFEV